MTGERVTSALFACDHAPVPEAVRRQTWDWDVDEPLTTTEELGRVNLRIDALEGKVLGAFDTRAADLVRIATFCAAADQRVGRGTKLIDIHRERWRRRFTLCIPVNEPAFWAAPEPMAALTEVLGFTTDDTWDFVFSQRPPEDRQLPLTNVDERTLRGDPDTVVLFSGGMDSLCATVEAMVGHGARPIVVSHRSAQHIGHWQLNLLDDVRDRFPAWALPHVSFWIHRRGSPESDASQRSRGFLFAALGSAVAASLGIEPVVLADNGYVSINPPISGELVGALASRGTHPTTLRLMNRLTALVFDRPVRLLNPLMDRTRAEALQILTAHDCAELIAGSRSCGKHRGRSKHVPHCGGCSQCVDRRFAVLAADLEPHDPAARYGVDIFTEALADGEPRKIAMSFVDFAHLTREHDEEELVRSTKELMACLDPDAPDAAVAPARLAALLQRHADEVIAVLDQMFARHSGALARRELPELCLLRLVAGSGVRVDREAFDQSMVTAGERAADNEVLETEIPPPQIERGHGVWHIVFEGEKATLPERKGLLYLARLLKAPGQELEALDLVGWSSPSRAEQPPAAGDSDLAQSMSRPVVGEPLLDRRDREWFQERAREIEAALKVLPASSPQREPLVDELEAIDEALRKSRGKGGRPRRSSDEQERARSAVAHAIRDALVLLADELPGLHAHLDDALTLGRTCTYDPRPPIHWQVTL